MKKTKNVKEKKIGERSFRKGSVKVVTTTPDALPGLVKMTSVSPTSFDLYIPDDRMGLL